MRSPKKRTESQKPSTELEDQDQQSKQPQNGTAKPKKSSVLKRTISTLVLLGGLVLLVCMGHFYMGLLMFGIQVGVFREIITLKRDYLREKSIEFNTGLNWYLFLVAVGYIFVA